MGKIKKVFAITSAMLIFTGAVGCTFQKESSDGKNEDTSVNRNEIKEDIPMKNSEITLT